MTPVIFDGADIAFTDSKNAFPPLPAQMRGREEFGEILTCWQLSKEEMERIQETGCVWLSMLSYGRGLPPMALSVEKPDVFAE